MIISPKHAFEQGWVTGLLDPDKQIGSDGIDLTIKRLSRVETSVPSILTESKQSTVHRPIVAVEPISIEDRQVFVVPEGVYDVEFNEFVTVPEGVAAFLLLRSSFVRAGHRMFSGLYDQGFRNFAGSVLHTAGDSHIEVNMRLAQIIFVTSEGSGQLYAGGYNYKAGDANWQDAALRAQSNIG